MASFSLPIPCRPNNEVSNFEVSSGSLTFLLGANGSGKSTLLHNFKAHNRNAKRISAQRQVWLESDYVNMTAAQKKQQEANWNSRETREEARYKDSNASNKALGTIFDIVSAENHAARTLAAAFRRDDKEQLKSLSEDGSLLEKMNTILKLSNFDLEISIGEKEQVCAQRSGMPSYGISMLSDGERNALLLIADVLLSPQDSLILLDEPERHLHRSISAPLLQTLLSYRSDCAFVIATHDLHLPLDTEDSNAILVRDFNPSKRQWTVDFIEGIQDLDPQLSEVVLGSRNRILFVEGNQASMDIQLYHRLFPDFSIHALGSCTEIERVVRGLNNAQALHWMEAYGIVDRDNRGEEEVAELQASNIFALSQYSVESLYYHPDIIKAVLECASAIHDIKADKVYDEIITKVINKLDEPTVKRMCAMLVQRRVRNALTRKSPDWKTIMNGLSSNIEFGVEEVQTFLSSEQAIFNEALEKKDLALITSRYPLRQTPVLDLIATSCPFKDRKAYESAVRKATSSSMEIRDKLINLLEPLYSNIVTH